MTNIIDFIAGLPGWAGVIIGAAVGFTLLGIVYVPHRLARWRRERKVERARPEEAYRAESREEDEDAFYSRGVWRNRSHDPQADALAYAVAHFKEPDRSKATRIQTGGEVPKPVTREEWDKALAQINENVRLANLNAEASRDLEHRIAALEKLDHTGVRAWEFAGRIAGYWVLVGSRRYAKKGSGRWYEPMFAEYLPACGDELPQPEAERLAAECLRHLRLKNKGIS